MKQVAEAFGYPFRPGWQAAWALGVPLTLLAPVTFPILFGYSVAAVRASVEDPGAGPPGWRGMGRILIDGLWVSLLLALVSLPFVAAWWPLSSQLLQHWAPTHDAFFDRAYTLLATGLVLGLPWGILLLCLAPPATARFALSGRPGDLFDVVASARTIRGRFPVWNLVVVGIASGWLLGVAAIALACVGVLPGIFYAILVSSHATAALETADPSPG